MKIALFHGNDSNAFLGDMEQHLSQAHEVRVCSGVDEAQIAELLDWADLAWADWASAHATLISRMPKRCPFIVRLHSYEASTGFMAEMNWQNIDRLVFVSPLIEKIFQATLPEVHAALETRQLANGVNLDRFTLYRPRERTHRIANVTYGLDLNKNLPMVLQCFSAIHQVNPEASLHIAGRNTPTDVQKFRQSLYMQNIIQALGLEGKVVFHGFVEDMNAWLEDKDQLISCSMFESFGYNMAEAMAKGITPLIHNFPNAHALFPGDLIFNTIDECVRISRSFFAPEALRQFIADNYPLEKQLASIDTLIAEVTGP